MNISVRSASSLAALAALGLAASAQAGEIYNNLGPGNSFSSSGRFLTGPNATTNNFVDQAARFNTGGHNHEGILVSAGIAVTGPLPFDGRGPVDIQVWSDGPTGPASLLASDPYNVTAYNDQLIGTTFGSLTLLANTNYWVVLAPEAGYAGAWRQNDQGAQGVTAGRTNGGAWNLRDPDPDGMLSLRVVSRVETVPEPATMAALGLGALAMLRRRKRA